MASNSTIVLVDNHREDGWFAVAVVMTVVETIFFALRIYSRQISNVRWGADDYLATLGYVFCIALNAVGMAITKDTWVGQHTDAVSAVDYDNVELFLKLQIPLALTYLLAAIIPKIAIIALYLRVFIQKPFRRACWVVQAVLVLYLIAGIASVLASCQPFSANWKIPGTLSDGEHCIDLASQYKAGSYPNIVTDLAIIILPIPVVWKIKKSTSEKLGLLCTFCLGIVGLAFSIARLAAFFTVFSQYDVLYTAAFTGIFTTLEPASYFLVCCMMTFRQLLRVPCVEARLKSYATKSAPSNSAGTGSHGTATIGSHGQKWPRHSLLRLSSAGDTAVEAETAGNSRKGAAAHRDEEWELGLGQGDECWRAERSAGAHSAAERLSRAHNRAIDSGMAVVSTDARRSGDTSEDEDGLMLPLQLLPTMSGEVSRQDARRVRQGEAIGVRREVDVRRD